MLGIQQLRTTTNVYTFVMTRKTKIITGIAAVLIAGGATLGLTRRDKDVTPVTFAKVDRADLTSKVTSNGTSTRSARSI